MSIRLAFIWTIFLFAAECFAAAPELPGNGIDDPFQTGGSANGTKGACPAGYADAIIGDGCDLLLPSSETDRDNDGHTSATDCDDTNRWIYAGVYTASGCTGGEYRQCQSNGTYTSCTAATLCEGDTCKYIDCGSGSDTTGVGTFASPWKSWGMVSGGSTGSEPAGAYTLTPGDYVYLLGSSDCIITFPTTIGGGATNVIFQTSSDGTSEAPIVLKRYPGATAKINPTDAPAIHIDSDASYIRLEDLEITNTVSTTDGHSLVNSQADYVTVRRTYLHDADLSGYNNNSCFIASGTVGNTSDHNFYENCDRGGATNADNVSAIAWLDDRNTGHGSGHSSSRDVIWWSTYDADDNGQCWREKHGVDDNDVGTAGHVVEYSYCINARVGWHWNSSGLKARRNVIYNTPRILYLQQDGSTTPNENNEFVFNTFVDCSLVQWRVHAETVFTGTEELRFDHNVYVDSDTNYILGNGEGTFAIGNSGTNTQKSTFDTNDMFVSDYNCFYNASTALNFSHFGLNTPAEYSEGGNYTFANWKTTVGDDTHSYNENPQFDTYFRATSANCGSLGWLQISGLGANMPGGLKSLGRRRIR